VRQSNSAAIERIVATYRAGRSLALLLDFDGTLSPLVDCPSQAAFAPGAERLLDSLAGLPRVLVGLVSGRAIDDLKRRAAIRSAWFVGTNGLEMEQNGTRFPVQVPSTVPGLLRNIGRSLQNLLAECPGCALEVKLLGLTLHFRHASAEIAAQVQSAAREALREFAGSILVVDGPAAIEIMPAVGCTKGSAVRALCHQAGRAALPLYAGDSDNDLPAFAAASELGGVTIAVGECVDSPVTFRVDDPAALVAWLALLHERLVCESAAWSVPDRSAATNALRT
jgi:trehalose 6-phosphate phosphatase